jgi:Pvc16 N-terminal domain
VSNYLAIATVTEALRLTLDAAVKAVPGASATALRPDAAGAAASVNVYLYQVFANAALRNADLPTRDSAGTLKQRPSAALDLHYLLTCHGKDVDFEPQRILGIVVRTLHSDPVLSKKSIDDASATLLGSDLAKAAEKVRFTPRTLSIDDLSKLWAVFPQTKYALSVTYAASVITIEPEVEAATPLPVRSFNVSVIPSFGPEVLSVTSSKTINDPADREPIVAGRVLHVLGRNLHGKNTRLRIGSEEITPPNANIRGDRILLDIANPPITSLRAGITTARVVYDMDFGSAPHPIESNIVPFVLAPTITAVLAGTDVNVTVTPPVKKDQKLVLMLNRTAPDPPLAYRFSTTAPADGAGQTIAVGPIENGTYLVRLQVDGAESPLTVDGSGHYNGPKVAKP